MHQPEGQASLAAPLKQVPAGGYYSPQLDGLRFCAAFFVFYDHSPQVPWPALSVFQSYGWLGIDLFLALSAFLITRLILLEERHTGSFSVSGFYVRRVLRIWPLYLGFVTAVSLWVLFRGTVATTEVVGWWLSHLTLTNNVLTAVNGWTPLPWSVQLWTISLEEQAYLILPLLLVAAITRGLRTRTFLIIGIAVVAILAGARLALFLASVPSSFIYPLPLRGDAFVFGSLAAILLTRGFVKPRRWMIVAGVLAMASAALFSPLSERSWYDVFGYSVTGFGAAAIVFGSQAAGMDRTILASQPFRYLGKISYGFYVYHLLALSVAKIAQRSAQLSNVSTLVLGFALTVGLAAISYAAYERPFLKLKERFQRVRSRPA